MAGFTSRKSGWRRWLLPSAVIVGALVLGGFGYSETRDYMIGRELVTTPPDSIPSNAKLVAYSENIGKPAYSENCASCHGADMKGNQNGVPNLSDGTWLYDYGRVSDIERTILYGIRAGLGKSHNVTDMPPVGRYKVLNDGEIHDVMAYVLSLNVKKHQEDPASVERGSKIFQDKGVCYDCHSRDATGISDYGAPNLTDDEWLYGGDEKSIYKSIYDGRHGMCPAWIGKLSFPTIRALAVFIHSHSQESPFSPDRQSASAAGKRPNG
ncbi:MAG TPA: c-type cytochrome [Micropepsaceae bacterium]|nr:c-type cytochrome [Micropepsaceae bacterium]